MAKKKSVAVVKTDEAIKAKFNRVLPENLTPKPVTHVLWTRVGAEVQLDFGTIDFQEINQLVNAPQDERKPLKLNISDRFILTPSAIVELVKMASEYMKTMKDARVLPENVLQDLKGKGVH